jgi:hypothetical protein
MHDVPCPLGITGDHKCTSDPHISMATAAVDKDIRLVSCGISAPTDGPPDKQIIYLNLQGRADAGTRTVGNVYELNHAAVAALFAQLSLAVRLCDIPLHIVAQYCDAVDAYERAQREQP